MEKVSKRGITFNTSLTKYEVVRKVGKSVYGWFLSEDESSEDWDVQWVDTPIHADKLMKMKSYQKINHFPGMYFISRKNFLASNLLKLKKKFPTAYNFFPKTWQLPSELSSFKRSFSKSKYYIVKPEAECQGKGIYLTNKLEEIQHPGRHIVQNYLNRPFLIDGLKFDLRIYVLVTGCDPLRIFVHEKGLTRFATQLYSKPSLTNCRKACMHLTNYAINKNSPEFTADEHKRSLQSTFDYLQARNFDVQRLKARIDDIIIKTLCSVQPLLSHSYKTGQPNDYSNSMCFEVLGFDVILDHKLKPWLLEVNSSPSFYTDSPIDKETKLDVVKDALQLLDVSPQHKLSYKKHMREVICKRTMTGKFERETSEVRLHKFEVEARKRDEWELHNAQGFRKIFPCSDSQYQEFIDAATENAYEGTRPKQQKEKTEKPPERVARKSDSQVFERLTQPTRRKFRTSPGLPPIIYSSKSKIHPIGSLSRKNLASNFKFG